jgi:hypothetical protein
MINGAGVSGAGVMGDGVIDGRGWAKMIGKNASWWEIAEEARKGGNQNCPRILVLNRCDNFTLYRIALKNSGNFHVSYSGGNGFTAWGVIIDTPKNARNTDGIDPGSSTNVTITRCYIKTGDDNVAIKAGGKCSHMTISHNHFYTGHGMSIGSETNAARTRSGSRTSPSTAPTTASATSPTPAREARSPASFTKTFAFATRRIRSTWTAITPTSAGPATRSPGSPASY